MAADISKLLNDIGTFVKLIENKKIPIETIMSKLEKDVVIVREQLDAYAICKRASIPRSMLEKFPDVKQRLVSSINVLIEEEIIGITENQLSEFSEELRKQCNKIEKLMTQIKWKDHALYLISISRIFEWMSKCWKYFHLLSIHFRKGITSVIVDDAHSNIRLKYIELMDGINKEYIFDSPVIGVFQMLKIDFSSRAKVSVK